MNKLTKVGLSALCGSLAAVASAQAGALNVSGGANATWSSNEGETTGNPIGMASGVTFTGTGELDNGTTFTLTITGADQAGFSASQIALTTPSMGTFTIDNSGGGIDRFDDMMPTAWEEVDGTSLGMGMVTVTGVKGHGHVEWSLPADMLPEGMAAHIAYSPRVAGGKVNDKAVGGDSGKMGSGYDIAVSHNALMDGLNVFAGYSAIEQANDNTDGDKTSKVIGATYAMGGFTVGYQQSLEANQTVGSATNSYYENTAYGISFSVNDNLSLSYGRHESDSAQTDGTSDNLEGESFQMAYSMGGATIKIAESSVDNGAYTTGTSADKDATTVMLSLAF
jgi:outer membrane protein OmpU|tara:strand:- start:5459 stop:6469 length:1011 start_codon:yes stop_codon:yes gene_type:complete